MDEKLYQQEFEKANRQEIEEQEARMERMILESEAQEARMEEKIRESEAQEGRMEQKVREIEAQEARMQHCPRAEEITIGDILGRIDTILIERDYIQQVIDSINHIPVNESPNGGFDGQARGQALEAIVQCRETTNQRVLSLMEKMYDDIVHPKYVKDAKSDAISALYRHMASLAETQSTEELLKSVGKMRDVIESVLQISPWSD